MTSFSELSGVWKIDPAHSRVGFSARHAMVTKVRGAFTDVAGTMTLDPRGIEHSHVEVILQAESLDTRNEDRDLHLRSHEFFDVETYPEITFRSTRMKEASEWNYLVVGDLTMHGVTREIAVPLELIGVEVDPYGVIRAGFEGQRRLNRHHFGLTWNVPLDSGGLLISDRVSLEFELSVMRVSA
ncbi:MAG: YceI family protein [Micrococcus sp.]|nr:YceI family protein [Micrococcus sp.]